MSDSKCPITFVVTSNTPYPVLARIRLKISRSVSRVIDRLQPHTKSAKSGGWESLRGGTPSPVDFLGSGHYGPRGLHQPPDRKDECVRDSPARPDVRRRTQQEHSREPRGDRRELSHTEGARLATPPSFFGCQKHPCFKPRRPDLGVSDPTRVVTRTREKSRSASGITRRWHRTHLRCPPDVLRRRRRRQTPPPPSQKTRASQPGRLSFSRDPPPRPRPIRSRYPPALPTRSQAT